MRRIVRYIDASWGDIEKGHMRCDASVSLRPLGDNKLYARTEIKNLNSFRNVEKALVSEIAKQSKAWEEGKPQEREVTAHFDIDTGETIVMRDKEGSADYRYFPEPDIPEVLPENDIELAKVIIDFKTSPVFIIINGVIQFCNKRFVALLICKFVFVDQQLQAIRRQTLGLVE